MRFIQWYFGNVLNVILLLPFLAVTLVYNSLIDFHLEALEEDFFNGAFVVSIMALSEFIIAAIFILFLI